MRKVEAQATLLPLGTVVKPYGKLGMIAWLGERYYFFVGEDNSVAMVPACEIDRWEE